MTPIFRDRIDHPMAWRGGDFSKDDISFDLSQRHIAALEDVLLRVRKVGLPLGEIRAEHCRHRALDDDLEQVLDEIQEGRGIVIVRGLPVEGHSVEDVSTMFWALGTHFGRGVSQSALGDLLGRVRDETPPGQPESARGYMSRRELSLHVDLAQIVGLMCVRQARRGGYSQYASGLSVHNEILATRADLMPILYRGFPYHRRGEEASTDAPITPYDVPVFSNRDGQVSVFMVREIINAAFRELGRAFTAEEIDAVDIFRTTAQRLQFEVRLEAGEASFLNNYTVMHARSEFDDWAEPEKKRLMLRLWLDVERKARPVVNEIHIYENVGGRSGIDPQPGRLPAVPKYRTPDSEVRRQAAAE
ncbi:MAG: TauD/TfdA family dioxygenase [Alphaproteobacteria bacterium]|nr:TauD/TfdA family dioxygenase [Alphaproteobacteria bacterium]